MRRIFPVCLMTLLLASCATPSTMSPHGSANEIRAESRLQREMAFKRYAAEQERVAAIGYKLAQANAVLCPDRKLALGAELWNSDALQSEYRSAAKRLYALDHTVRVKALFQNSPAAKAGIRRNDVIYKINGKMITPGEDALEEINDLLAAASAPPVTVTVLRNGKALDAKVNRVLLCGYDVAYHPDDMTINASADGEKIDIPRGMVRFAENDTELALVMAHEFAHDAMQHIDKQQQNALGAGMGGLALDLLALAAGVNTQGAFSNQAQEIGAGAYSVSFEQEADYVGMYFMARAGYRTDGVANFWRRWATERNVDSVHSNDSHPTSPERFIAISKTHREIRAKTAKRVALKPEMKV